MNSLTNYSHKEEIATSHKAFKAFIETFSKINPNLTETDIYLIKECIDDDSINISELEYGVKAAYKDPDRYGKVEWNHVWKWIKHLRSPKKEKEFDPSKSAYFS